MSWSLSYEFAHFFFSSSGQRKQQATRKKAHGTQQKFVDTRAKRIARQSICCRIKITRDKYKQKSCFAMCFFVFFRFSSHIYVEISKAQLEIALEWKSTIQRPTRHFHSTRSAFYECLCVCAYASGLSFAPVLFEP